MQVSAHKSFDKITMNYHEVLKKIEEHVSLFFGEHVNANLFFHNWSHTKNVVDNSRKIAEHYQLDERSIFIISAAAWFHDTGQLLKSGEGHERKSSELAQDYLESLGVNEEDIREIKQCILATTMPQEPLNLNEKIICDADLFNLGTPDFSYQNKMLRKEIEALGNKRLKGTSWRNSSIEVLENHTYHTEYCQLLLNKTKAANLAALKETQERKLLEKQQALTVTGAAEIQVPAENKIRKRDRPARGIETMFRISASKNVRISEMADNKAHIMISVNSIIISVVLGLVVKSLEQYTYLIIPTVILLIVNVFTIIFSVLATRPKISNGLFTKEEVADKSVNLLYFGSYYNMDLKSYEEGLSKMMEDRGFLYGNLTKDMFSQGKVLGRKYKLLRISYTIFLFGIVISVLAFSLAIILSR